MLWQSENVKTSIESCTSYLEKSQSQSHHVYGPLCLNFSLLHFYQVNYFNAWEMKRRGTCVFLNNLMCKCFINKMKFMLQLYHARIT